MGGAAQAAVAVRAVRSTTRTAATSRPTARSVGAEAGDARRHATAAIQARGAHETGTAAEAGEFLTAKIQDLSWMDFGLWAFNCLPHSARADEISAQLI